MDGRALEWNSSIVVFHARTKEPQCVMDGTHQRLEDHGIGNAPQFPRGPVRSDGAAPILHDERHFRQGSGSRWSSSSGGEGACVMPLCMLRRLNWRPDAAMRSTCRDAVEQAVEKGVDLAVCVCGRSRVERREEGGGDDGGE